jgi:hypothetical protein
VVIASHYIDKEQDLDPDPDPDSYPSETMDPDPQKLKRQRIRICIKVMRIRKPGARCNLKGKNQLENEIRQSHLL